MKEALHNRLGQKYGMIQMYNQECITNASLMINQILDTKPRTIHIEIVDIVLHGNF